MNDDFVFIDPMAQIIVRYIKCEELTDDEIAQLEAFVNRSADAAELFQDLTDPIEMHKQIAIMAEGDVDESWKRISKKLFDND